MRTVGDVAAYVRSKNAGPFWVTIDLICSDTAAYEELCRSSALSPQSVARMFGIDPVEVQVFHSPRLRVIKVSFPRTVPQGSARDRDCHAGQYFVAILGLPVTDMDAQTHAEAAEG